MRQSCTFDELPEQLKERVNGVNEIFIKLKDQPFEIIENWIDGQSATCIVKDIYMFGIFESRQSEVHCTWLNNSLIKSFYKLIKKEERKCKN